MKTLKHWLPIIAILWILAGVVTVAKASELQLSNTYSITPDGINLSYVDGSPENRDGPYLGTVKTYTNSAGTTFESVTGVGTATQRLYGMEQLTQGSFKEGDVLSVTIKASACQSIDGLPALARFTLASDWNDNYYLSSPASSIDITNGTNGWKTYSIVLNPSNFSDVWPVGNTGIGFDATIANAGVIGLDFLSANATNTTNWYNSNGQLPSFGVVGQVSIGEVAVQGAVPEPSTFALLAVAGGVGALVYARRKKACA
jgi:hypothetical protein